MANSDVKTSEPEHYRVFDLTTTSLSNGNILVHSNRTKKSIRLSGNEASILFSCRDFEPLTVHAKHAAREFKKQQATTQKGLYGKLLKSLEQHVANKGVELPVTKKETEFLLSRQQEWANEGFLVSREALSGEITNLANRFGVDETETEPITAICIPTCNRPVALKRGLPGYIENNKLYGRTIEYFVSDDSEDPEMQLKNKTVLQDLAKSSGARIYYINLEKRERLAELLSRRSGISPEICRYAVLGDGSTPFSGGANRNTLLLQTAGQLSVQVDDDSICRLVLPEDYSKEDPAIREQKLAFSSYYDPYEYWHYENMDKLSGTTSAVDLDFLGLHERLLSRSVLGYIEKNHPELILNDLFPDLLNGLIKSNPPVGVTYVGYAGDSGLRESGYLTRLFLEGASFHRLTESPEEFPSKFTTRYLVRAVNQPTISNSPLCMGLNIGMDQRNLLPPFIPSGRNEDVAFGQLLKTTNPGVFSGYLPYALIHDPINRANRDPSARVRLQPPRLNDLIWWLVAFRTPTIINSDPVERFRELGSYLADVGTLSNNDFYAIIRSQVCQSYSIQLQTAERLLASHQNALPAWKDCITSYMTEVQKSLADEDFFKPFDLLTPKDNVYAQSRKSIHMLGELLTCWPEMIEASKNIDKDEWRECISPRK